MPASTSPSPEPNQDPDLEPYDDSIRSIPVPHSLATTTSSLPTTTQKSLITYLHQTTSIADLSDLLHDRLSRTGWTDRVRALALELLQSGACTTFPELYSEVLRRAKIPRPEINTANGVVHGNGTTPNGTGKPNSSAGNKKTTTSSSSQNQQSGSIAVREGWFGPDGLPDVRVPLSAVEDGVDFVKERIKDVVEIVPGSGDEAGSDED